MRHLTFSWLFILIFGSSSAFAGGFYLPDRGARSFAMGGAFIAGVDDLNAQWLNPAGLLRLRGKNVTLGVDLGLIFSDQSFKRAYSSEAARKDPLLSQGYPSVSDNGGLMPSPSFGIASDFGLEDWIFALGVYGPYGGSNAWPDDGPQRYSLIHLSPTNLTTQASVAWQINDVLSLGLGFQWVNTVLSQRLMISAYPGVFGWSEQRNLDVMAQVDATDLAGFSGNIGLLITPTSPDDALSVDIGISAQLPVSVHAKGKLSVRKPEHYYFSQTTVEGDAMAFDMTFPAILRAGLRLYDDSLWSVEFAFVYEMWSQFDKVKVSPTGEGVAFKDVPGIGRYQVKPFALDLLYKDVFSLRLGGSYSPESLPLTFRAGTFFETGAPPEKTLSVFNIDGNKMGLSLGLTYEVGAFQIDLSGGWIETFKRTVRNSEATQVNPIYLADPKPYSESGPSVIGNGSYSARHFILATSIMAGF